MKAKARTPGIVLQDRVARAAASLVETARSCQGFMVTMMTPLLEELPPQPGTASTTTSAIPSFTICMAGTSSFNASRFMRSMPMPSAPDTIAMNEP